MTTGIAMSACGVRSSRSRRTGILPISTGWPAATPARLSEIGREGESAPGSSQAGGMGGTTQASWQARAFSRSGTRSIQIDPPTPHRHAFPPQQLGLHLALRDRAVGADDPMPGKLQVSRGENPADQTGRFRIDVAIRLDVTDRDVSNSLDDARETRSAVGRLAYVHPSNLSAS